MEEIIKDAEIDWEFFVDEEDGYFDIDVFAHYLDHGYPEMRETVSGIPASDSSDSSTHCSSRSTHSIPPSQSIESHSSLLCILTRIPS